MTTSTRSHLRRLARPWLGGLLGLCAACASTWALAQAVPEMALKQVGAHTYYVEGLAALGSPANQNFISNAGFVVARDGVVVIDTLGSPALARRLVKKIAAVTPKPVTHVILTHYHADHIYGLQVFKQLGTDLAPWVDGSVQLVPADRWLDGSTTLELAGTRFVVEQVGPSHTPEDLAIYVPSERVLFAGDLIFSGRLPFVGKANSDQWITALNRLLGFDAQVVVPGHGGASTDPRKDIGFIRDYLGHLRRTMGQASSDMQPFDEAYAQTDWSAYEHMPMFPFANRMNAYNTYLLMEQEGMRGK
jgi:glyoxylase-like metal-dependent hydrolase (beta-lactamase superfamily II)